MNYLIEIIKVTEIGLELTWCLKSCIGMQWKDKWALTWVTHQFSVIGLRWILIKYLILNIRLIHRLTRTLSPSFVDLMICSDLSLRKSRSSRRTFPMAFVFSCWDRIVVFMEIITRVLSFNKKKDDWYSD